MIAVPLIVKIVGRPILRGLDAMMEKLAVQIRNGENNQALETVTEIRAVVAEARKHLE